jgi:hypothetical protein
MNRGPHEPVWLLALAGASLASALASCGGGGGNPGAGNAMLAGQQAVTAQAPPNNMQPMPARNADAATLMQMGDAP